MLLGNKRPGGQTGHLGDDDLSPGSQQRVGFGDAVDCQLGDVGTEVGLVEHEGIPVKAEQVQGVDCLGVEEEVVEVTASGRGVDPLKECAGGQVAVVENCCRPARDNFKSCVAVGLDGGGQGPEGVLLVHEDRASVVANHVFDTVVHPGLDRITVVQASDGRGNQAVGEPGSTGDTGLGEPGDVELDLLSDIRISGVVQRQMGVRMRDVSIGVEVAGGQEPGEERVELHALERAGELGRSGRPLISSGTEGLLELKRSRDLVTILDEEVVRAKTVVVVARAGSGVLDVAVSVVAQLDEVVGSSWETCVDVCLPSGVEVKIGSRNTEVGVVGRVQASVEMDIINLGGQVDATEASIQATGQEVNVCVLQQVGRRRPDSSPGNEEDQLLAHATAVRKTVDDGSSGLAGERSAGVKGSDLPGGGAVSDRGRVVEKTRGRDTSALDEVGGGERGVVGDGDQLLHTSGTAALAGSRGSSSAKVNAGVDIETDHANTEMGLVVVNLLPLRSGEGAGKAGGVVVDDFRDAVWVGG